VLVWVGGDTSTRVYVEAVTDSVYVSKSRTHPDTIFESGSTFTRKLLHQNWRGLYAFSTDDQGEFTTCTPAGGGGCTSIAWPAGNGTTFFHNESNETQHWYGSLVMDQRDATGLSYRRNRYYDPVSGQFTQSDRIGIAGGLNLYGYANGDPINFTDPFGLSPCEGIFDLDDDSTWNAWAECMGQHYEEEDGKRAWDESLRENFSLGRCAAATTLLMGAGTLDVLTVTGVGSAAISIGKGVGAAVTSVTATLVGARSAATAAAPRVVGAAAEATRTAGAVAHGYATGLPVAGATDFIGNDGRFSAGMFVPFSGTMDRISRVGMDCAR
jgi:RHS repeat-associated protein